MERGILTAVFYLKLLISFFGTGLVSNHLYLWLELGTGQRKEKKREKNKFSNKPIVGQTL